LGTVQLATNWMILDAASKESLRKRLRKSHVKRHQLVEASEYCEDDFSEHGKHGWRKFVEHVLPVFVQEFVHLFVWNKKIDTVTSVV